MVVGASCSYLSLGGPTPLAEQCVGCTAPVNPPTDLSASYRTRLDANGNGYTAVGYYLTFPDTAKNTVRCVRLTTRPLRLFLMPPVSAPASAPFSHGTPSD
jgi:hypothetical protein